MKEAFRAWVRAIFENTGRVPKEIFLDIRTYTLLAQERDARDGGPATIDGVVIHVIGQLS